MLRLISRQLGGLFKKKASPDDSTEPIKYKALRCKLMLIMLAVSIVPLLTIALISNNEAQRAIKEEALTQLKAMVNKTKHSFEMFLIERKSAVSFIASSFEYEDLADQRKLEEIFNIMSSEFGGFVDLGLIDTTGLQVSYVGPYDLKGKVYNEHEWFQKVIVKGEHISDVFLGYRKFPHFIIAVKNTSRSGKSWILRVTIDTDKFDDLIASMGLDRESDAFILNHVGMLQTNSRFFGRTQSQFPFEFPTPHIGAESVSVLSSDSAREMILVSSCISDTPFVLMMVKSSKAAMRAWQQLESKMMAILVISLLVITASVYTICTRLVQRFKISDFRREAALHNMEHSNKLASIGRLAAGVAHEINNPMSIINEKAGLMLDLVARMKDMPQRDRFLQLTGSIIQSVERCSKITHRLLGFARRMDLKMEMVDVNEVIEEVFSFLEQEAIHRNIDLKMKLEENLPRIESDHGQLQQVFLNILNNALDAVETNGKVWIKSFQSDTKSVSVSIEDNGRGISSEIKERIFEPFFTTRGTQGTGLGLSITYGLVQKLGGRIDLESEVGAGSRFTVNFPIRQPVRR